MALIDLDKFLASFITEMKECSQMRNFSIPRCIKKALDDQGLEYKDGEIVKSQRRIVKKQLEQTVMDYEKAFKEAYERASLRFGTNVANELFLEYKESKEERTRRKLIEFFSDWSKTKSYCWGIRITDIMDWLEKQGEQKPAWSEEDERMYNIVFEEYKNRQYYSHPTLEDYDISGQILGWLKSLKDRVGCKVNYTTIKEWNEEDERAFHHVLSVLEEYGEEHPSNSKFICNWLKSIKARMGGDKV